MLELINNVLLQCKTCKRIIPFAKSEIDFSREESCSHGQNGMGDEVRYIVEDEFFCPNCNAHLSYSIWGIEYPIGAFDSIHRETSGCDFVELPQMQVVFIPDLDYALSYKESPKYIEATTIRKTIIDISYRKDLMYDLDSRLFEQSFKECLL